MKRIFTLILGLIISQASFGQLNMTLIGQLPYSTNLSDVWGYVDNQGNEYALVGAHDGFSIVDLSNPANPTEIFFESGPNSTWRDIKTWNNHAYVITEGGGGMLIVDLNPLPASTNLTTTLFTGVNYPFGSVHNIFIDENGVAYLLGANYGAGGAIMLDLTVNPMVPVELGVFDELYFHDGMARGDTLWGGAINNGLTAAIDVSDKSAPTIIASWSTPHNFTHNCWLSDNNEYIYTTDEVSSAFLTGYDVSDLNNVSETDRWQPHPGTGVIPHNTHFMNDYVITSFYTAGINVLDVSRPHNMIETGNYDTSPNYSGNGFNGCWGVYPWLPSGRILATDIEEGLYVLGPNYLRACYVEGQVSDSACGASVNNATIEIVGLSVIEQTDLLGSYATGTVIPGTYDIKFSKSGYNDKILTGVNLTNGVLTNLNVLMTSNNSIAISGLISSTTIGPLEGAQITLSSANNNYAFTTDSNGEFSKCNVIGGNYDLIISKWGYQSLCLNNYSIGSGTSAININMDEGYYDDFSTDLGWTTISQASSGDWVIGEPEGTIHNGGAQANPDFDVTGDCGEKAFVTGNGGGGAGSDDIDAGLVFLSSPTMDLTSYGEPYLNYYAWFYNDLNFGSTNDYIKTWITNGIDSVLVDTIVQNSTQSTWLAKSFRIRDYLLPTAGMKVVFEAADIDEGQVTEAAIDLFSIVDSFPVSINSFQTKSWMMIYPNPTSSNSTVKYQLPQGIISATIKLSDIRGRLIKRYPLINNYGQINLVELDHLDQGTYFIELFDLKDGLLNRSKLVLIK